MHAFDLSRDLIGMTCSDGAWPQAKPRLRRPKGAGERQSVPGGWRVHLSKPAMRLGGLSTYFGAPVRMRGKARAWSRSQVPALLRVQNGLNGLSCSATLIPTPFVTTPTFKAGDKPRRGSTHGYITTHTGFLTVVTAKPNRHSSGSGGRGKIAHPSLCPVSGPFWLQRRQYRQA